MTGGGVLLRTNVCLFLDVSPDLCLGPPPYYLIMRTTIKFLIVSECSSLVVLGLESLLCVKSFSALIMFIHMNLYKVRVSLFLSLSLSLFLFRSLSLSLSSCIVAGPSCDPSVCIMLEDIETELVFLDTAHTDLVRLEHMVSHHMMLLGYT